MLSSLKLPCVLGGLVVAGTLVYRKRKRRNSSCQKQDSSVVLREGYKAVHVIRSRMVNIKSMTSTLRAQRKQDRALKFQLRVACEQVFELANTYVDNFRRVHDDACREEGAAIQNDAEYARDMKAFEEVRDRVRFYVNNAQCTAAPAQILPDAYINYICWLAQWLQKGDSKSERKANFQVEH